METETIWVIILLLTIFVGLPLVWLAFKLICHTLFRLDALVEAATDKLNRK